jgi:hypothetical protein
MVAFGQMPLRDVGRELQKFEAEAIKILKETGVDHVLYGVKEYDGDGDLDTVRFYLEPMSEQEFEDRVVKNSAGMTVYAVHKR